MRFRSLLLFVTAIAAGWLATRTSPGQPFADPAFEIFDRNLNRTLVADRPRDQATVDLLTNGPKASQIARAYYQINPAKSILIYDCDTQVDHWCAQPELSFPNMLRAAGRAAKLNTVELDGMVKSWQLEAANLNGFAPTLDDTHFRLIAITNRIDMAVRNPDLWKGAEVHFAYGRVENGKMQPFFVILEFRLAPAGKSGFASAEFRELAASWAGLSKVADPVQYARELKKTVRACGIPLTEGDTAGIVSLRLRINHGEGGNWRLSQLRFFVKDSKTFQQARLDEQLNENSKPDAQFFGLAQQFTRSELTPFKFYEEIWTGPTVTYGRIDWGMGPPEGLCGSDYEKARKLISIQQCTGCHMAETNTMFTHLFDVDKKRTVPSGFLIGQDREHATNIHPSLVDLYYPNDKVVWRVDVPYQSFTGTGCTTPTEGKKSTSRFHDVARRTLFLATMLAPGDDHLGNAWRLSTQSIE